LGVFLDINLNTSLSATKWNIGDCELESHQSSESLNFLEIDVGSITSTALDGKLVGGVLGSVACDGLEGSVVSSQRDVESYEGFAGLDVVEFLI
jgi:hypothetical protein